MSRAQPATEWRIKTHAPGRRYVHIATHGVVQDGDPLFASGLLLDPPAPGEPVESEHLDDFLQTYEMFDLELDAEVVVLSACDTGLGLPRAGEGLVGISRALFFAGARCLVLSLWPVADLPTRQLMEAFYEGLRANTAAATALSQAKELLGVSCRTPISGPDSFVLDSAGRPGGRRRRAAGFGTVRRGGEPTAAVWRRRDGTMSERLPLWRVQQQEPSRQEHGRPGRCTRRPEATSRAGNRSAASVAVPMPPA